MGKPAARMGDMTAHGGSIVVGCPTVLIGGQPAARIGDNHVCPMFNPGTPPPPHVGGPVSIGSPMVLIGGMPAARVGDMVVCAGPPDTIALGCPTVLIGEGASGSASGGGGGAGSAAAAQASAAVAQTDDNATIILEEHWVEIEFLDSAGNPVSGVPYKFTDPDGNESEGTLRLDGTIRRDGMNEGECEVQLFSVSNAQWDKEQANVGEQVKLSADVEGFEDSTLAIIEISLRDLKGADMVIETIQTEVSSGKVEEEWEYILPEAKEEEPSLEKGSEQAQYFAPEYYFAVLIKQCKARSGLLCFKDFVEIELKNDQNNPVGNVEYMLYLANGEVRQGTLDGSGYKKEENVPPGRCSIRFPNQTDFIRRL